MKENKAYPDLSRGAFLLKKRFNGYFLAIMPSSAALYLSITLDGILVGNILGKDAFSAICLAMPVLLFISTLSIFCGVGGSTTAAREKGNMMSEKADDAYTLTIVLMVALSLLFSLIGFCAEPFLIPILSSGNEEFRDLLWPYYRIHVLGMFPYLFVPGFVYLMRLDSSPRLATAVLLLCNFLNLALGILFLKYFKLGTSGAALATVGGYFLSGLLFFQYLRSPHRSFHFRPLRKVNFRMLRPIILAGLPASLESFTIILMVFAVNSMLMIFIGKEAIAAFAIGLHLWNLFDFISVGTAQTLLPISSCLYGEKDHVGIRIVFRHAVKLSMIIFISLIILVSLFPDRITLFFGINDPAVMNYARQFIPISTLFFTLYAIVLLFVYHWQIVDRARLALTISVLEFLLILPGLFWVSCVFFPKMIWWVFPATEILMLVYIGMIGQIERFRGKADGALLLPPVKQSQSADTLDVSIHANQTDLNELIQKIKDFCKDHDLDERTSNRIQLCIDEMGSNTIAHGYRFRSENTLDVKIVLLKNEVLIRMRDEAKPFNPIAFGEKNNPDSLGLKIIRGITSRIDYTYVLNFNNLLLTVPLNRGDSEQ